MTRNPRRRSGFTLIELLVVISLIILLASLTVGAVFRVLGARRETNTNTHLLKIDLALSQMYKSKLDLIKKEPVPLAIIEMTRNQGSVPGLPGTQDMDRARAFHLKMRLREEFPQNFGDVGIPGTPSYNITFNGTQYQYRGKATYQSALKNPQRIPPASGNFVELEAEAQSAACLVLILSQGAGGATIDPETIGPTKLMSYPQQDGSTLQLRVFIDAFGKHIAFRRLADDDMFDALNELNQPPFVGSGAADPQDPARRLGNLPPWPGYASLRSVLAQPNPGMRPYIVDPFDGRNRGPFAFSAGKDSNFITQDDLYSFRVQQSGRGN